MKKLMVFLFVLLLLLTPVLAIGCDDDDDNGNGNGNGDTLPSVTLKVAVPYTETSAVSIVLKEYCDAITEETDGKLKFEYFWAGTVLKSTDMLDGLKTGMADMGIFSQPYTPNRCITLTSAGQGLLFQDFSVCLKTMNDFLKQNAIVQDGAGENVRFIAPLISGEHGLITIKPVYNIADCDGLKMRSAGYTVPIFAEMKMEAVSVPAGEMADALNKGTLEGIFGAILDISGVGLQDVVDYWIKIGLSYPVGSYITMNLDKWNSLPEEYQDVLNETMGDIAEDLEVLNNQLTVDEKTALENAGQLTYIEFSQAEIDQVQAWGLELSLEPWTDTLNDAGLPGDDLLDFLINTRDDYREAEGIS